MVPVNWFFIYFRKTSFRRGRIPNSEGVRSHAWVRLAARSMSAAGPSRAVLDDGIGGYNANYVKGLRAVLAMACIAVAGAQPVEHRLEVRYAQERPVDRTLGKVDAYDDDWISERDYQAIDAELKKVAEALKLEKDSFAPLTRAIQGFRQLELVEFKILSSIRDRKDSRLAHVTARVELGGDGTAAGIRDLIGEMAMTWASGPDGWALESATAGEFRETVADGIGFTEITESVFGRIDSYHRQLAVGIDHWRDSLDAALGTSVYGHQGVSLGDFDGDGLEDLYISQPGGLPNRLFRNLGDGTFADATRRAGLDVLDETSMSLFGDLDNDGDQDLLLIGAEPMLFRNVGDGKFVFEPESGLEPSPDRAAMFTGAALADYDMDGDLDLYVCAYDFWQAGGEYDAPTPYYDAVNGPPNLLFRNDGSGRFEEVSELAGLEPTNNRFSFAAAWGDYDSDGDPDLYVANDFGRNNLYRNGGDGRFTDVAAELGVEDLGAGMSAAWGDYDGDGDLDLYTANMWSSAGLRITASDRFDEVAETETIRSLFRRQAQGNSLFRNDGDQGFSDVSERAGVRSGRWAWASDFVDLDNDGFLDLFVQNGYITGERLDDL